MRHSEPTPRVPKKSHRRNPVRAPGPVRRARPACSVGSPPVGPEAQVGEQEGAEIFRAQFLQVARGDDLVGVAAWLRPRHGDGRQSFEAFRPQRPANSRRTSVSRPVTVAAAAIAGLIRWGARRAPGGQFSSRPRVAWLIPISEATDRTPRCALFSSTSLPCLAVPRASAGLGARPAAPRAGQPSAVTLSRKARDRRSRQRYPNEAMHNAHPYRANAARRTASAGSSKVLCRRRSPGHRLRTPGRPPVR